MAPGAPVVTVAGEGVWPLSWYLRDVAVNWASRIEQANTPVIVADWDPEGALEKQLTPAYDAKRVPIRAWWFPEPQWEGKRLDAPDLQGVRPLVALPRDLEPDRIAGRDGLRPQGHRDRSRARSSRCRSPCRTRRRKDYPAEAIALPAARVFGPAAPGGLKEPRGLATDAQGNLYVADTKNSRIVVFDGNGGFVRAIGSEGNGDGQLKEPCGVAVGPDGLVYVADTWNHRVARFTPDGQWKGAWVASDPGFFGPRALVFAKGFLDVADTGNKRIVRFDADGKVVGDLGRRRQRARADSSSRSASRPTRPAASRSRTRATTASRSSRRTARSCASSRCSAGRTSTPSRISRSGRRTASSRPTRGRADSRTTTRRAPSSAPSRPRG